MKIIDFKVQKQKNSLNLEGRIGFKVLLTISFLVLALVFGQLVFAGNLATDGEKLGKIQSEIKTLEEENNLLKTNIAKESSLSSLSKKAKNLGLETQARVITP